MMYHNNMFCHPELDSGSNNVNGKNLFLCRLNNIDRLRIYPQGILPCKTHNVRQQEELRSAMTNGHAEDALSTGEEKCTFTIAKSYPSQKSKIFTLPQGEGKKIAFTLAEVLITLGIIGVVAALTLPNLIADHQKKVTITQLKAAYQMFSEVIVQVKADNGGSIDLSDDLLSIVNVNGNNPEYSQLYIDPYISGVTKYNGKIIRDVFNASGKSGFLIGYATDKRAPMCTPKGFCYWVLTHGANYHYIAVDLNGPKKPNKAGRDIFIFDISGTYVPGIGYKKIEIPLPFLTGVSSAPTLEERITKYCNKTSTDIWNGQLCFTKIVNDGWKIKDDYPW